MSIDTTRKFMEKSGCGLIVMIALGLIMGASVWTGNCSRAARQEQANGQKAAEASSPVIAEIGEFKVKLFDLEKSLENAPPSPQMRVSTLGFNLGGQIDVGLRYALAKEKGITISNQEALDKVKAQVKQSLDFQRTMAVSQKLIKENATDAEWSDFVKSKLGKGIDDLINEAVKDAQDSLNKPDGKAKIIGQLVAEPLSKKYEEGVQVTEDLVKKGYDEYTFKRINFGQVQRGADTSARPTAEAALAQIKGGLSFDEAAAKYGGAEAKNAKTPKDITVKLKFSEIEQQPDLSSLVNLKPGEVSPVIIGPGGVEIYQFVKKEPALPKDYDKNKKTYSDQFKSRHAGILMDADIAKLRKSNLIVWKSPAFKVLYDFSRLFGMLDPDQDWTKSTKDRLAGLVKPAQEAISDPNGQMIAPMLFYTIMEQLWTASKGDPRYQTEIRPTRKEAIQGYLTSNEDPDVRMGLVEILIDENNKEAAKMLLQVAESNFADAEQAVPRDTAIREKLGQLKAKNLATPEEAKKIQDEIDRFAKDKKALDDEKKKQADEAKKAAEEAKKNEPKPVERKPDSSPKLPLTPSGGDKSKAKPTGK